MPVQIRAIMEKLYFRGAGGERETERKSLSATDMGHLLFRLFLTFYLEAFNFHIFILTDGYNHGRIVSDIYLFLYS